MAWGSVPTYAVGDPWTAATVNAFLRDNLNYLVNSGGGMQPTAADHYFGAHAAGGSGTRTRVGSNGDANNAYVMAEGSGTSVGLILRPQGSAGTVRVQDTGGLDWWYVRPLASTSASESQAVIVFNSGGSALARPLIIGAADSFAVGYRTVKVAN